RSLARPRRGRPVRPIRRIAQGLDPLLRVLPSFIHARTALGRGIPALSAGEVAFPERPGAALQRAHGVDAADAAGERDLSVLLFRGNLLEEDAVVIPLRREAFLQADPLADLAAILLQALVARESQVQGEAA